VIVSLRVTHFPSNTTLFLAIHKQIKQCCLLCVKNKLTNKAMFSKKKSYYELTRLINVDRHSYVCAYVL